MNLKIKYCLNNANIPVDAQTIHVMWDIYCNIPLSISRDTLLLIKSGIVPYAFPLILIEFIRRIIANFFLFFFSLQHFASFLLTTRQSRYCTRFTFHYRYDKRFTDDVHMYFIFTSGLIGTVGLVRPRCSAPINKTST